MTTVFLSYARGDDVEPFDPVTSFVARLHRDLEAAGFDVWFDRVDMPSRSLTFHQEIRDAIAARDRLLLVVGPKAVASDYVRQEWQFAWREADKVVTPILRLDDYSIVPDELKLLPCEDFRDDAQYPFHLDNLIRQLHAPAPPLGKLIAVPSLPPHYLQRTKRLGVLRDALRADLDRPVVIGGAAAKVGMHGMGGIGKSVLASAVAHDRKVREAFPDGVVWFGLGSLPDVPAVMRRVHRDLGGNGVFETEHQGKVELKKLLANKAVLLILDDVWRRADVDWFDVLGSRCRALVTTRDLGLLTSLGGVHYVVELLTDHEAKSVLALTAGVIPDELPSEAAPIIAECGRLPLAVALCGGMIRRGLAWDSVLVQLQQARIDRIADRHAVEPHHQSVWHAMHVSVEFLPKAERRRFMELAVFPPDEVTPQAAIVMLWAHTGQLDDWESEELLVSLGERSLVQLVAHTSGSGQPPRRHASLHDLVYDYVKRAVPDVKSLHDQLLSAYWAKCKNGWPSGPNDGYFFQHLCGHLADASRTEELARLLFDFGWLQAKTDKALVQELIEDYDEARQRVPANDNRHRPLELMQRSLRLAAHVISRDPLQLPSQLIGRMHSVDEAGIREVLEVARSWRGSDWLCPLNGNLDQPGAPLLMTLDGHTGEVTRLRVTSDGRRTISVSDDETMRLWDLDRGRELLRLAWPYDKGDPRRLTDDGQRVIAVSWEEAVGVWDLIRGRLLREFRRDGDWHTEVAVTSDGRLAISASGEGRLQAWNLDDGSQSFALECQKGTIRTVRLSPDDRWAVLVFADGMISACDLHRRRFTWKLAGPTDGSVRDVVVSPDGSRVALVGGTTVSVRDLKSGQEISVVRNPILEVEVAALTPDGLWALCGSRSGTIAGWDLQSGRGVVRFTGHRARVTALALTPDGRRGVSASCDQDQGLQVWELETGRVLRALGGPHGQCCDDIVVTRDGRHVVAAFGGGTFQAWDLESGNATRTVSEEGARFYRTAIDTDGRFAISVGFDEPVLQFWDLENGWKSHAVRAAAPPPVPWNQEVYKTTIDAVAVSPDGRRCAGAVRYHVRDKHFGRSCGNDEYGFAIRTPDTLMITLWDCESGREVRTLQHEVWWVEEMIFSPDGRHLVVAASDHYVEVWNTDLGEVVRRITDLPGRRLNFSGINLSADGQRLLWASDASISLLELGSGTVLRHRACLDEDVTATAFAPHNALVTAADNVLTVWDAATGEERHRLEGHDAAVAEFLVAGDGRRAVSRSRDQTLKVWDLENGRESGTLHCHSGVASALAITPDGKRAITGSSAGILEVWDLGGSPRSPTLQGHDGPVTILAVDARGRRAFSTSSDGTLRTWDLETFEQVGVLRFPLGSSFLAMVDRGGRRAISAQNTPDGPILLCWDLETNQLLHTLREHRDHFTAALLSPDGSIAITAFECEEAPERWSYGLSVWDLNEGKLLQKQWLMTCEDVVALAMTPDGETGIAGLRSGSVGVLGLKTGGEVRYLKGHTRAVRALAVTPDGRRVISGSSDSTLRVWGLQERTESMVLGGHGKAITHVLVTPDGIRAVSASTDGTCQVWDHQNGAQLLSLEGHRAPVNSLALSPDGRSLVSASADWTLKIWNLLTGHCLATFTGEGPLKSCVCVPDGRTVIVGEESGRIHFLRLVREHDG